MMCRLCRSILLSFLCLMFVATSAAAECAWVLWMELPNGSGHWRLANTMQIAFEQKGECDRIAKGAYDARAMLAAEAAKRGEKVPGAFFTCLPDTVDPRGPKGK